MQSFKYVIPRRKLEEYNRTISFRNNSKDHRNRNHSKYEYAIQTWFEGPEEIRNKWFCSKDQYLEIITASYYHSDQRRMPNKCNKETLTVRLGKYEILTIVEGPITARKVNNTSHDLMVYFLVRRTKIWEIYDGNIMASTIAACAKLLPERMSI